MREVFGERGIPTSRGRASHKTDRSRGWRKTPNHRETIVNTGGYMITTPPHVGKGVGNP